MNRWDRNNEFHSHRSRLVSIVTKAPGGAVGTSGIVAIAAALNRADGPHLGVLSSRLHRAVRILLFLPAAVLLRAQTGDNVLLVVNRHHAVSRQIADYYASRRSIPARNVCYLTTTTAEEIDWKTYQERIEAPIAACLKAAGLEEKVLYIVTTQGVPLKVDGPGSGPSTERASVDSELALLYGKRKGATVSRPGPIPNPFFGRRDEPFRHPRFPIYLVTRLAAYDVADVKAMIDRSLAARNRGKFVIDKSSGSEEGNSWLGAAALLLPADRVVLEETSQVLYGQKDVIGYASWGSNDSDRKSRFLHLGWLPGAIATEFVSTDGRTFRPPPPQWDIGRWNQRFSWYAGAPQTLTADYISEGASGASGQVFEPYLAFCPRPDFVLPAYASGRNLAESFYLGVPGLSWMTVVIGDPLMRLRP